MNKSALKNSMDGKNDTTNLISIESVSVYIGKKTILNNVALHAQPGQVVVLLGKNGSGKTTLLRTISGNISRISGELFIDGKRSREYSSKELAKTVSLMPQFLPNPAISVRTLAEYARSPYGAFNGKLNERDEQIVTEALKKTEMLSFENKLLCHISGGERQMAYVAMMLAQDCKVKMMDEPTSGLDVERKKLLRKIISEEKKKGSCLIVSLHDLDESMTIGDRFVVMDQGSVVFDGTKSDLLESGVLETVFGKQSIIVTDGEGNSFPVFRDK